MAEIWVTSDTHFLHANMLKFTDEDGNRVRPFGSLNEMHELIVKNWNSVVGPGDKVYHLGDVTMQYNNWFNDIMYSLNGRKRLILGNHDQLSAGGQSLQRHFEKVDLWTGGKFKHLGIVMSHMPLHPDGFRHAEVNAHGHVHLRSLSDKRYRNVCGEVTNYTPVNIETLRVV